MLNNIVEFFQDSVHTSTPILFVALGELVAEKSGVLNLGLEGVMALGAFSGFFFSYITGSVLAGILFAMVVSGVFSLVHGFVTITLRANQVVSGLTLSILGLGLAKYFGNSFINKVPPMVNDIAIPLLHRIPIIGKIFFQQNIFVYLVFVIVGLMWFFIKKTREGLFLQICGENIKAAENSGINIRLYRYLAVVFGGIMAGVGGAFLTIGDHNAWMENITSGRGWIALAIVIFGRWNPIGVLVGSLVFGILSILPFRLEAFGINVSTYFFEMLPFIFTIIVLVGMSAKKNSGKGGSSPSDLGNNYHPEIR